MTVLAVTPNQKVEFFPRRAPAFGEEQEFYVPGSLTIADIRTSERKESMSIKSIFEDMLIDEVRALRQLHQGWDSYNAPNPKRESHRKCISCT
jgi:hypothetical protein